MRILLTIQYLGTRYAGWQLQENAPSVQQVVEEALATLFREPVRAHAAGRTDAGVHAAGQRAHADVPFEIPPRGLLLGLNQLLPHDVRVTEVIPVADGFHARFDAVAKTYAYRIWNDPVAEVFHAATHAHVARTLDVERMHAAAQAVAGTHDFRAFTVAEPEVRSTVRTLRTIGVTRRADDARAITLTVTGDGFLRTMVRRIAGSLIEIGLGRLEPSALVGSLEPDFEPARWTAPAKGLVLVDVRYE